MSTLTSQEPDILDLDYFYQKHQTTYSVAIYEDNLENVLPISKNFQPTACFHKELRTAQRVIYFFPASLSTAIITFSFISALPNEVIRQCIEQLSRSISIEQNTNQTTIQTTSTTSTITSQNSQQQLHQSKSKYLQQQQQQQQQQQNKPVTYLIDDPPLNRRIFYIRM